MSSSIHIQKVSTGSFLHNDRTMKVSYLIDTPDKNECSTPSAVAIKRFNELKAEAMKNYTERTHQKMQKNTIFLKEAIVNLQEHHTLEDLKPIKEKLEDYGFTVLQMSIHRDEGFVNKNNKKEKNFHAHITMFNLDVKTGKTVKFGKHYRSELSRLQTFVAKTLKMQRGKVSVKEEAKRLKVRVSKATRRLDTHDYKRAMQIKEKELELQEQEQYNFREYQKKITALENLTTEQKKELHRLNSAAKKDAEKIAELKRKLEEKEREELKEIKELAEMREKLEVQKIITEMRERENSDLKQDINTATVAIEMQETVITALEQEKGDLEQNINTATVVEEEVAELQKTVETLQAEKTAYKQDIDNMQEQLKNARETIETQNATISTLRKENSDLEQQVQETQKVERALHFTLSKSYELQIKLNDAEKTIETLKEEKRDLIAKYREIRDAFTEVAQALSIKFVTVKQVVADIISKFSSTTKEVVKEPEPEPEETFIMTKRELEIWEKMEKQAIAEKQQNKFPKLK